MNALHLFHGQEEHKITNKKPTELPTYINEKLKKVWKANNFMQNSQRSNTGITSDYFNSVIWL